MDPHLNGNISYVIIAILWNKDQWVSYLMNVRKPENSGFTKSSFLNNQYTFSDFFCYFIIIGVT